MTETKRRAKKEAPIDWEKIAKHLQEALESLIVENAQLEKDNRKLIHDNIKLIGIASYLEKKLDGINYPI